jgi:hypothetical protein
VCSSDLIVFVKTDGSEVGGTLASFDETSAVVIKESGDVVEVGRHDIDSVRATAAAVETAAPAPKAASLDRPTPPDLASVKDKSQSVKEATYDDQFKVVVDPLIVAFKMGAGGRFFPLAQWEPVFREVPDAYQLFQTYNNKRVSSTVFLIGGNLLLIPGLVMLYTGPLILGLGFDVGALVCDIIALIVQPTKADLERIATVYNAQTRKSLQLSYGDAEDESFLAMGQPPRQSGAELTLLTLRL